MNCREKWRKFDKELRELTVKHAQELLDSKSFKIAVFNGTSLDKHEFFSIKSLENFILLKKRDYLELDKGLPFHSHSVERGLKELDDLLEKGKQFFKEI